MCKKSKNKTFKYSAIALCEKCNGISFELRKICEGQSLQSVLISETMCHDGMGWDLNTFDIICTHCLTSDYIINLTLKVGQSPVQGL